MTIAMTPVGQQALLPAGAVTVRPVAEFTVPASGLLLTPAGLRAATDVSVGTPVFTGCGGAWGTVVEIDAGAALPAVLVSGHGQPEMVCLAGQSLWGRRNEWQMSRGATRYLRMELTDPAPVSAYDLVGGYWSSPWLFRATRVPRMPWLPADSTAERAVVAALWLAGRWVGEVTGTSLPVTTGWRAVPGADTDIVIGNATRAYLTVERDPGDPGRLQPSGVEFGHWLMRWFADVPQVGVPGWLYGAPPVVRQAFLAGLLAAPNNSHRAVRGGLTAMVASRAAALSLRLLGASVGFAGGLEPAGAAGWRVTLTRVTRSPACQDGQAWAPVFTVSPHEAMPAVHLAVRGAGGLTVDGVNLAP